MERIRGTLRKSSLLLRTHRDIFFPYTDEDANLYYNPGITNFLTALYYTIKHNIKVTCFLLDAIHSLYDLFFHANSFNVFLPPFTVM